MALKIVERGFLETRVLKLDQRGVKFTQTAFIGGVTRLRFDQIDFVLMADNHVLTLGRGTEVFSIQTKPGDRGHQNVVQTLLRQLSAVASAAVGAGPSPR